MRTSPVLRGGPGADRWLGPALRAAVVAAMLAAGTGARAEPGEASATAPADGHPADPASAAVVDLQRQVSELRSDLLDERERRIERWQEANAFVLVLLGMAIGVGGIWTYAKFRSIAEQASIGSASERRYMAVPPDMLPGTTLPRGQLGNGSGPLRYLVAAGRESTVASSTRGDAAAAVALPPGGPAYAAEAGGQAGSGPDADELQRHEEAIADCSEAIRLDPRNPALYLERAEARNAVGRFEEAVADYDRAIHLDPHHAAAYLGRCRAKSELGQHEEAVEDYDRAVRLDPDSAAAVAAG